MERHMDTSSRQSVILQMLNSGSGTCVSLAESQPATTKQLLFCPGCTALMGLQTKNRLCGVAPGLTWAGGQGQSESCMRTSQCYFVYQNWLGAQRS